MKGVNVGALVGLAIVIIVAILIANWLEPKFREA